MNPDFWRARWAKGEIGFHQPTATPALERHHARLGAPPRRVFVPLAGKSHDVTYLAQLGHAVVAVELVEDAVRAYFAEAGLTPTRETGPGFVRYAAEGVTFYAADVFALTLEIVGPLDAVFDRAATVALPPELRGRYAQQLTRLAPGADALFVLFEHDTQSGPPFSVPPAELRTLLPGAAAFEVVESPDVLDENPRFRDRGASRLLEHVVRARF
jgi:thiopurine S-methyltransferase